MIGIAIIIWSRIILGVGGSVTQHNQRAFSSGFSRGFGGV
jgi:hypothetical protein